MVREQLAPPSEKTVGHASGKKSGDERPFANAINRPEKEETHADGNRHKENVDGRANGSERASESMHDSNHKSFRRQHQQTRKDHGRNAESREARTETHLHEGPPIIGGFKKARHPHCNVKNRAEERADGQLLDGLDHKVLRVDQALEYKEKDVREENEKAHGKTSLATEHNGRGAHGTGAEPGVGHDGDAQRQHNQAEKKNQNS